MPAVTAFFLAMYQEGFCWWLGILAIIGGIFAHLGMNLADDYFDYKKKESGFRDTLARAGFRARTAKCPYIVSGEATVKQTLYAAMTFGILALIPGVIVLIFRGWMILLIVALAVFLGESYSGEPLRLSFRGFGELDIGVMFGPLLMAGVFYAACGHFSWSLLAPAISMGLLVTAIVYTHSILDYEADQSVEKNTLAAVLKTRQLQLAALFVMLFVPYMITVVMVILQLCSPWYLLVCISLPWAVKLFLSVREFKSDPQSKVAFQGWYGPMGNWDAICQANLDWFMFRWYLARNIMTAFALLYVIVSIVIRIRGSL
jgi:1,4-dihydroxy-2-naphthoate octaprenyltransferase